MENTPESREHLQAENKRLFEVIKAILERVGDFELDAHWASFVKANNPNYLLQMGIAYDATARDIDIEQFAFMPEWFNFPASFFVDSHREPETSRMTTPYGVLNNWIIGADGRLYFFDNIYFFQADGQATKFEGVFIADKDASAEVAIKDVGLDYDKVAKVDFIPNEDDSRYVDLQVGDYEKVDGILGQIEAGQYIKHHANL